jgi:putative SOS response-associated peptidase YedK
MCYSAEVQADLEKLLDRFKAEISQSEEIYFQELLKKGEDFTFMKEALHLAKVPRSNFFKTPAADNRIFPGYFTWVMVHENGKRVFKRMRYRVRPKGSKEEIPTKYNVFNARIDSLESRQTWQKLFTKQHGLFPFVRFFEWVEEDNKKRLVSFLPENREIMWAPCLWDYWENPEKTIGFYSFALITDDPPPEVSARGHDRCPIFLKEKHIDEWLSTSKRSREEWYLLLKNKEDVFYRFIWAA